VWEILEEKTHLSQIASPLLPRSGKKTIASYGRGEGRQRRLEMEVGVWPVEEERAGSKNGVSIKRSIRGLGKWLTKGNGDATKQKGRYSGSSRT